MILVDMFQCTEDVKKRRLRCDADQKSDVEAQYSVQFEFDQLKYTVSITFYYTKCSLWIQGPPIQIDGMSLAQFFVVNYLEKVSNMIERSPPRFHFVIIVINRHLSSIIVINRHLSSIIVRRRATINDEVMSG